MRSGRHAPGQHIVRHVAPEIDDVAKHDRLSRRLLQDLRSEDGHECGFLIEAIDGRKDVVRGLDPSRWLRCGERTLVRGRTGEHELRGDQLTCSVISNVGATRRPPTPEGEIPGEPEPPRLARRRPQSSEKRGFADRPNERILSQIRVCNRGHERLNLDRAVTEIG